MPCSKLSFWYTLTYDSSNIYVIWHFGQQMLHSDSMKGVKEEKTLREINVQYEKRNKIR